VKRRTFVKSITLAGTAAAILPGSWESAVDRTASVTSLTGSRGPLVVSTWDYGPAVTETAYNILARGGDILEAVEQAVWIPEADPAITSVGYGGYPDRDGKVTLDACIMDGNGNCGSVAFLEHIVHPVSVARKVMEKTPHVMLVGEGALRFALENGFKRENLLTPEAESAYREWLKTSAYTPPKVDTTHHDTIGLIAMDRSGNLAGACSTSGLAWKVRGRVGDSPIIGAGLYVDNDVGAATATGLGEAVIKVAGSFLIVELMRNGKSPGEACRLALERIIHKQPKYEREDGFLVGFLAMNKDGEIGGFSYRKGFQYSVNRSGRSEAVNADFLRS
jgi:N4-(beta-N-acetylglucosaminyl)-L-asparaginase